MIDKLDMQEKIDKYRELNLMVDAVERMPKHVKECEFQAPPFIPVEFRKAKIPSNMFFSNYKFKMSDMLEYIKELQGMYGKEIPADAKKNIDKGE